MDQTNAVWDRDQPGNPEDEWKNDEKKEYFANTIVFSDIEPKLLMNTSQLTSVGLPKKKNSLIIPMYLKVPMMSTLARIDGKKIWFNKIRSEG